MEMCDYRSPEQCILNATVGFYMCKQFARENICGRKWQVGEGRCEERLAKSSCFPEGGTGRYLGRNLLDHYLSDNVWVRLFKGY